jgi:hypothetical protein
MMVADLGPTTLCDWVHARLPAEIALGTSFGVTV